MNKAYLIGIKGVGMSALAVYLKQSGFTVSGSDDGNNYVTTEILEKEGIEYFNDFNEKNISSFSPDWIIISAAYGDDNIEVKYAKTKGVTTDYYSDALAKITQDKRLIAVAGVHGKTTTTSMLALIFQKALFNPSYIIGAGKVSNLDTNAKYGNGDFFILEADEYRKSPIDNESKFLSLQPEFAIISSIELDHPDIFKNKEEVYQAFYKFAKLVKVNGKIIICNEYEEGRKLINSINDREFITYGFNEGSSWQIDNIKTTENETSYLLKYGKESYKLTLKVPGRHNALNATAAFIIAKMVEIDPAIIIEALKEFNGAPRRYEKIYEDKKIIIIDDYAHHPTAIRRTLEATKEKFPNKKIIAVFQPHTFSRTKALLSEFAQSFSSADEVILTSVYASAREKNEIFDTKKLIDEFIDHNQNFYYFENMEEIQNHILENMDESIVVLTIGAGNIYELGLKLKEFFEK